MDSLSQIVLGAAIGEAVLGRKAGNKAAMWGAVLGTIPDLDVVPGNLFIESTIDRLLFHRGFSHSIIFSLLFAWPCAWLIKVHPKIMLSLFLALIYGTLVIGIPSVLFTVITTVIFAAIGFAIFKTKEMPPLGKLKEWTLLAFIALLTHPILDAFTSYGTQLYWPFKERVAWNTIFVADPIYTVPFLICVIAFLFFRRTSKVRRRLNYLGLFLSCSYLAFTVFNKQHINSIFEKNLVQQNISYSTYQTKPMPLNNLLWSITINGKDSMYLGYYSLLDENENINFISFNKNHEIGEIINDQKEYNRLTFFSDNYYVLEQRGDTIHYGDLKFGIMGTGDTKPTRFIMSYDILNTESGTEFIQNFRKEAPKEGEFGMLMDRVKGKKFQDKY
ncbi:MAG: metal-dependent hydrolase [Bacteroidia bacterium]|nr:metal-dependent hydrolase [Bacteroidia bacterium]